MDPGQDLPDPEALADQFVVYEVRDRDDGALYVGEPLADRETVVRALGPLFRSRGYRVAMEYRTGEYVLVVTERSTTVDEFPWTNVGLFLATVVTTLVAGSRWYGVDVTRTPARIVEAWPFATAVLGVLAVHEFGHYALSRYHGVETSLPYFIPIPNLLGTLGAVISIRDNVPSRRALFDIGVSGPLAGLVATVLVTAVGVSLPPVDVGTASTGVALGYPPLVRIVAAVVGEPLRYADPSRSVNPVVIGGWVGTVVTFLNLLPVGQLDGAHVTRAVVGDRIDAIQRVVPLVLFGIAGYLFVVEGGQGTGLWVLWGVLALLLARVGGPTTLDDDPVDGRRRLVAVATIGLGLLCFTPTPIVVV